MPDNQIIGQPAQNRASVTFSGEGNLLYCEDGVELADSVIRFAGSGSVVYLCRSKYPYHLNLSVYNDSAVFMGGDSYMNGVLHLVASEQCHIVIGKACLLALGSWLRTADPHLLYDSASRKRINPSRSIFVGDHVWLGQDAFLLKGAKLGSGTIAAARCVVPAKKLYSNCVYGGNPVRLLKQNVFYDGECTHAFRAAQIASRAHYPDDRYIYSARPGADPFAPLDAALGAADSAQARLEVLKPYGTHSPADKNRFAMAPASRGLLEQLRGRKA